MIGEFSAIQPSLQHCSWQVSQAEFYLQWYSIGSIKLCMILLAKPTVQRWRRFLLPCHCPLPAHTSASCVFLFPADPSQELLVVTVLKHTLCCHKVFKVLCWLTIWWYICGSIPPLYPPGFSVQQVGGVYSALEELCVHTWGWKVEVMCRSLWCFHQIWLWWGLSLSVFSAFKHCNCRWTWHHWVPYCAASWFYEFSSPLSADMPSYVTSYFLNKILMSPPSPELQARKSFIR